MAFEVSQELARFYPSDRPRRVHLLLASLTGRNAGQVVTRSLHTTAALLALVRQHAASRWVDCRIDVVPTLAADGEACLFSLACTSAAAAPTTVVSLQDCPTARINLVGGNSTPPAPLEFPISFSDSGTSPLIAPVPHVLPQPALSFHYTIASTPQPAEVYFQVFLTGVVEFAGSGAV